MAYDGKLLARARTELENIRAANSREHQRRLSRVYAAAPEIERLEALMRTQMTELVRLTVSRAPDLAEKLDALRRENLDAQIKRAELLVEHGWPVEYLDDIYSCPKCRDTGIYDSAPCSCLEKLYNRELTKELGALLQHGDESFERFDLGLYDDSYDSKYMAVPRSAMTVVFNSCRKFAENFPNVSSSLLLQGAPGLGKTYLSACIAREVAAKGFSVCYDSASAALDTFEKQKFSRDAAEAEAAAVRVRRMLDCDLMILDDLGTEIITPASKSALYTLINSRLTSGRKTIISTNCSDDELQEKYTAQIYSRIAGEFLQLPFAGRDIRLIRKGL